MFRGIVVSESFFKKKKHVCLPTSLLFEKLQSVAWDSKA